MTSFTVRMRSWFLPSMFALAIVLSLGAAMYAFYYRDHWGGLGLTEEGVYNNSTINLQGPTRKVAIFFANRDGSSLVTLEKEIRNDIALIDQLRTVIQALMNQPPEGLITPIPEGTKLQSLFIDSSGNTYLDFSREIQQNHIGGLTAELLTIGSIVNTLLFNFKEIKGVQLLVEGSEVETLAGHIDCRKPFSRMLVVENK